MDEHIPALERLMETVRRLRAPGGCEWDRSQTISSLRPFLLEEAHEAAFAVETEDWDALASELGDLLLHIVMAALIAQEEGLFDLTRVSDGIADKLVRRHPHVFGTPEGLAPEEVEKRWEAIKAGEKGDSGFFSSVPPGMPALQTAWRIQQRAEDLGYRWTGMNPSAEDLTRKILSGPASGACPGGGEPPLGSLLFSVVDYMRNRGLEPESVLRGACRSFIDEVEAWRSGGGSVDPCGGTGEG